MGTLRCHWRPRPHADHPQPQGSDSHAPSAPTPLGRRAHGIPSRLLSPIAHTLFPGRTAECCVKHSRAGRMRAQNAVPPHSHVARVHSLPHYRDCLSSLPLGGDAAVYQCQGFLFARYCRESQGSSRCRRSPESDLKAGDAGLNASPLRLPVPPVFGTSLSAGR